MKTEHYTDFQIEVLDTMRDFKRCGQTECDLAEIAECIGTSASRVGHALGVISCRQNFPLRVYRANGSRRREACNLKRKPKVRRGCSCRLN